MPGLMIVLRDPRPRLGVGEADLVHEGLGRACLFERTTSGETQAALEQHDGSARLVGNPRGELHRLCLDLRPGMHAVDQGAGERLSLEVLAAEHHLGRLVLPHRELQQARGAHARREAEVHEVAAVARLLGEQCHVAGQSEREAAANRVTGHRRDGGHGELDEVACELQVVGTNLALGQAFENFSIAAGAKDLLEAGHDADLALGVLGDHRQPLAQLGDEGPREAVLVASIVHAQQRDALIVDLDCDLLACFAHERPPAL